GDRGRARAAAALGRGAPGASVAAGARRPVRRRLPGLFEGRGRAAPDAVAPRPAHQAAPLLPPQRRPGDAEPRRTGGDSERSHRRRPGRPGGGGATGPRRAETAGGGIRAGTSPVADLAGRRLLAGRGGATGGASPPAVAGRRVPEYVVGPGVGGGRQGGARLPGPARSDPPRLRLLV